MTRLDIIQALMRGAGMTQYAAAKVLREHDAEVRQRALGEAQRRDALAGMALAGMLARGRQVPPEEVVHETLQHVDIMLKELSL